MKTFLPFVAFIFLGISLATTQTATTVSNVHLRTAPSSGKKPITTLSKGTKVQLVEPTPTNGYYHVQTLDSQSGYVYAKYLKVQTGSGNMPASTPSSASTDSGVKNTATLTPDQALKEEWRKTMMQPRQKQKGCYQAVYPDKEWHLVPCGVAPVHSHLHPPKAVHPLDESASGDYVAKAAATTITSAIGTFAEIDNGANVPGNAFSLQINTNEFPTSACSNINCSGFIQFVYDSAGRLTVETFLFNYLTPETSTCPQDGVWTPQGPNCTAKPASMPVPVLQFANLAGTKMTVETENGFDEVTLSLPGGALYQVLTSDSFMKLAGRWQTIEFNVLGEMGSAEAIFNPGALISVVLSENDGTQNAPVCAGPLKSNTLETTNLTLGPCTPFSFGSTSQGIRFIEGVLPTITSISPTVGPEEGGTVVTINGTGFSKNMEAGFIEAESDKTYVGVNCISTTQCTVSTPPHRTSGVDIVIGNLTSTGSPSIFSASNSAFMYEPFPSGIMVPSTGSPAGGTKVTIEGHNFSTAPGKTQIIFNFNGVATAALNVSCSSTTLCTMTTPPLNPSGPGPVRTPVSATVNGWTSSIGGFTYGTPAPPNPTPTPRPPTCEQCIQNGQRCVMVNGKPICKGTVN